MSKSIDRRAAIRSGLLFASVAAVPSANAAPSPAHDPRVKALEALIAELKAAIASELDLEGRPGHSEAVANAERLEQALQDAADDVYAVPAATMTDIALRARLAEYWCERHADCVSNPDRSGAELVRAVLIMAGLVPVEAKGAIVRTVPALIAALGGREAVADYAGVSVREVVRWERTGMIPAGWHHRFARKAKRRGFTLDDEVFA